MLLVGCQQAYWLKKMTNLFLIIQDMLLVGRQEVPWQTKTNDNPGISLVVEITYSLWS